MECTEIENYATNNTMYKKQKISDDSGVSEIDDTIDQ